MLFYFVEMEVLEMTEQEKAVFEKKIRAKVTEEQRAKRRAYRAVWREKNREHIRNYDRAYRARKKSCEEVERNGN